ncbi:hypothetical protein EYC80_008967 [Monilinia laxa]|uniref:Uncharacterized protein n=1 Tax=Monilinia laxa TaxID=61186 RepID=A0A5N6K1Z4_MONLA|nr:hypothetical protein EYC80_008967 [Monilinia laxa]
MDDSTFKDTYPLPICFHFIPSLSFFLLPTSYLWPCYYTSISTLQLCYLYSQTISFLLHSYSLLQLSHQLLYNCSLLFLS